LEGRSELDLILWLLFLCDGCLDLAAIAQRLDTNVQVLVPIVDRLVERGVLELV
jgi:aminopeptidase-like protein